ncbi:GNAT family N-acetyltransferase [cyanobacterium endosymbiont of Epithemia clementina EcSB]|uniref:GNAT family N-acetyltransferase n=1 Tax=cyanobacterium endosymbiont of Epithemia clementina EcSB TaxID=3034674 RepID=UPI0024806D68|nr:GNAT family N-acetyltransferase [cyanobacterium endosymbiont of Epithemia clementina EcSB]WGT68379.1 GNAT family N-acetyltransferase [cyanobacterium endosymbiont of Epithemia clementina EcSB]
MPSINLATQTDILDIHQLIKQIFFEEKLTKITAEGYNNFFEFIACSSLRKRLVCGSKMWLYKINTELIGILEISRSNHILLYFVKKNYRGQKIGKILFNHAKSCVLGEITANSTDYALPIYLKLGFVKTGPAVNRGGIIVFPFLLKNFRR